MRPGTFITFEGPDGAGKTTQLQRLAARLQSSGYPVTTLRQPGGTALGTSIRSLLVDSHSGPLSPLAELGLMFSDRAQAIAEIIQPALAAGSVVLCDRFTDSSEAYQGGGRELGSAVVHQLHAALCGGLQPDLTLLLLPPLDQALARARHRNRHHQSATGADENRFEEEPDSFFRRVYAAYQAIAAREPARVLSITSAASVDVIEDIIAQAVLTRLGTLPHQRQ